MIESFVLGVDLDGVCAERPDDPEAASFRDLPIIDGAAEALWRLSDAGVWIRIVTNRLHVNGRHQAAVVETVAWLDEAHIPYRDLCFLGAKPQVEADLYVDDSPDNIAALRKAGNEVIVFDQPYNREQRDPRAENWSEVEEIVMERFTERQGIHGVQPQLPGVDGTLGRRLGGD
jgi:5'(3')-deoxyribonucleotidase